MVITAAADETCITSPLWWNPPVTSIVPSEKWHFAVFFVKSLDIHNQAIGLWFHSSAYHDCMLFNNPNSHRTGESLVTRSENGRDLSNVAPTESFKKSERNIILLQPFEHQQICKPI